MALVFSPIKAITTEDFKRVTEGLSWCYSLSRAVRGQTIFAIRESQI
jgi:hypothetical protein